MRETSGVEAWVRWVLLLPGVLGSIYIVNCIKDAVWDELIFSALGGERLQLFLMLSVVHPTVVVGAAHHLAPSHKNKVAWSFAFLWALFMLAVLWSNLGSLSERWPIALGQVIGFGVSFAVAAVLEDESGGG